MALLKEKKNITKNKKVFSVIEKLIVAYKGNKYKCKCKYLYADLDGDLPLTWKEQIIDVGD